MKKSLHILFGKARTSREHPGGAVRGTQEKLEVHRIGRLRKEAFVRERIQTQLSKAIDYGKCL